jgi:hypothetical protein
MPPGRTLHPQLRARVRRCRSCEVVPRRGLACLGTNRNDHEDQPFEGLLDDVVICADALSAGAISALWADADPASVCGI